MLIDQLRREYQQRHVVLPPYAWALKYDPDQPRGKGGKWIKERIDTFKAKYPVVAHNFPRSTHTEMGSIESHTGDVGREWDTQLTPAEMQGISERFGSDVGKLMQSAITLHDIGKAEAIESGAGKHAQHEHTIPIMQDVLTKEGFSKKDISLATELLNHDLIGPLFRGGKVSDAEVAVKLTEKAKKVGMNVADFVTLQLAFYQADASAYPYITQFMHREPSGKWTFSGRNEIRAIEALTKTKKREYVRKPAGSPEGEGGEFAATGGQGVKGSPTPFKAEDVHESIKVPSNAVALIAKHLSVSDAKVLAKAFGIEPGDPKTVVKHLNQVWRGGGKSPPNDYSRFDVFAPALQMAVQDEFKLKGTDQSFQQAFHVQLSSGKVGDPTDVSRELYKQYGKELRAFVRAQYTATQAVLAKQGIKHLVLFRGIRTDTHKNYPGLGVDVPVVEGEVSLRPIASFATKYYEARAFSVRNWVGVGVVGQTIATRVSAKDVLALPGFGIGKANESEVVTLGGQRKALIGNAAYHHGLIVDESTHPHVAEPYDFVEGLNKGPATVREDTLYLKTLNAKREYVRDEKGQFAETGSVKPDFDPAKKETWYRKGGNWNTDPITGGRPYGWGDTPENYEVPPLHHKVLRMKDVAVWGYSHSGSSMITGESAKQMGIEGYRDMDPQQGVISVATRMLEEIATDATGAEEPLYHSFENVEGTTFRSGDTMDLPLTATAGQPQTGYATRSEHESQEGVPTVFVFPKGTKMVAYGMWPTNPKQRGYEDGNAKEFGHVYSEAIVAGRFRVVKVETVYMGSQHSQKPLAPGETPQLYGQVVHLEPIGYFNPFTGKWEAHG